MLKKLTPADIEHLKKKAAEQQEEFAARHPKEQEEFIRERARQSEEIAGIAEENIDLTRREAPEGDRKTQTIEELQAEVERWKANSVELYAAASKPDLSKIDLEKQELPGYLPHRFTSFRHFLNDLMIEGMNPTSQTDEMKTWNKTVLDNVPKVVDATGKATLTAGDAEEGGTLIPVEYANQLLDRQKRVNPVLTRAMIIPMGTNKIDVPYLESFNESQGKVFGNVQWFWRGEEATFTGSNFETGVVELVLRKCTGLARVSRDLIKYSPQSIEAILRRAFDYGMSREINRVAIRGTGAGQPLGVLNSDTALIAIAKETGQAADTFIYDNVLQMISQLYVVDDDLGPATWFANRTVLPQIGKLSVAVGTGGSGIFLANDAIQPSPNYTMLGIPLQWSDMMSAVGDQGDVGLFDWSQYLVGQPAGQGDGAEFATSIHLYFDAASTAFRFIFDMDGRPWWPESFDPEFGVEQAPFIVLAERA
jgi:HK97 family phage major capsid protein